MIIESHLRVTRCVPGFGIKYNHITDFTAQAASPDLPYTSTEVSLTDINVKLCHHTNVIVTIVVVEKIVLEYNQVT